MAAPLNWQPADTRRFFTAEEDQFVREHYPLNGSHWVGIRLNRSHHSIRQRAIKLGLKVTVSQATTKAAARRPAWHQDAVKTCPVCDQQLPLLAFAWDSSRQRCKSICNPCRHTNDKALKAYLADAPSFITSPPCDNCRTRSFCADTGWSCTAFKEYVEHGWVHKSRLPKGLDGQQVAA